MGQTSDELLLIEEDLMEQAAQESGVGSELLRRLIELRQLDFPSLDKWGSKAQFERAIGDFVRRAASQAEQAMRT